MEQPRCRWDMCKLCDVLILIVVLIGDTVCGQQIKNGDCMYDFTLPENRLMVKCGDKTAITRFSANASTAFPTGEAARTEYNQRRPRPSFNFNYSSVSASTDKDLTIVQQVMYGLEDVNRTLGIVSDEVTREMEMISNAADMLFSDDANLERAGPMRNRPRRPLPPLFRAAIGKVQAQNQKMLQGVQEQNVAIEEAITSLKKLVRLEEEMVKSTMTLAQVLSRRVKELTAPLVLLQSSGKPQSDGNGQFPQPKQGIRDLFNRPPNYGQQRMPYRGPPRPPYPMEPRQRFPMQNRPPPPRQGMMRPPNRRLPQRRGPLNSVSAKTRFIEDSIPRTPSASKPLTTEKPVTCSPLASIGSAYMWVHQGTSQGTIMADYLDEFGRIWVMLGYGGTNQIIEYENDLAFESAEVRNTYVLPFYCEGTGSVVYGGCLYCLQSKTNHMVRYDLTAQTILKEVRLVSAGVYNTYPYQFGALSDIDFAVDELGLWVIYSGSKYYGRLVISKLDPETLAIQQTWITDILKKRIGNSFMVCGVLYAINSFTDIPTFIRYTYDTKMGKGQIMNPATYPFLNTADSSSSNSFTVMADYDPKERRLFTWNTGRIEIYQVI